MVTMQSWVNSGSVQRTIRIEPHVCGVRMSVTDGEAYTFSTTSTIEAAFKECMQYWPQAHKEGLRRRAKFCREQLAEARGESQRYARELRGIKEKMTSLGIKEKPCQEAS